MEVAKIMEDFGMKYARFHLRNSSETRMIIKRRGLIFEMRKVSSKQRVVFPSQEEKSRLTTIDLPESLFEGSGRYVVNALFSITDDGQEKKTKPNISSEIISPVISSTLDPKPEGALKDNVTIALEHFKEPSKPKTNCVYWEEKPSQNIDGQWSTKGCTVKWSKDRAICSCNHLTRFALLMEVDNAPTVDHQNTLALSYITYIGCSFSLLGEALTIFTYKIFMEIKEQQSQIRVNLAISLAVAQTFFLSGITSTSNLGVCTFVAAMLHYFYLVAFGWMMLEGVYLYLMVVKVFNSVIKMRLYYIFAWGLPAIVVSVSIMLASNFKGGIKNYTQQNFCWISIDNGLIWAFAGPVILISLVNVIILVLVVREITKLKQATQSDLDTIRRGLKTFAVLFPLLGLTWLFGLLSVTNPGIVFQYIFTLFNSFQGFLIFGLHVLRSSEIRGSIERALNRWKISRKIEGLISLSKSSQPTNDIHMKPKISQTLHDDEIWSIDLSRDNRVSPESIGMEFRFKAHESITPIDI